MGKQADFALDTMLHETYKGLDIDNNVVDFEDLDGATGTALGADFCNGLGRIHDFVDRVRKTDTPAFHFVDDRGRRQAQRTRFSTIPSGTYVTPEFRQQYEVSEQVRIFLEAEDELDLAVEGPLLNPLQECLSRPNMLVGELANKFLELIRAKACRRNFRRRLARRRFAVEENYRRGLMLINGLFERYARLNVIRIDLNYRQDCKPDIDQAKADLTRLLNNARSNSIFDSVVGYIWRLEWGFGSGYHWHVIFFMDGSKTRSDYFAGKQIGEYWENVVTEGRGRHHNCNTHKNDYRRLGIGMISHADESMRDVLVNTVLRYLAKLDELVRPTKLKGVRTFGTSQLPDPHPGTGRKRRGPDVASGG